MELWVKMKKNQIQKNIILLTLVLTIFLAIASGCLETPETKAAMINPDELSTYGWEQVGDVTYENHVQEIQNVTELSINIATAAYQDREFTEGILQEMQNLQNGNVDLTANIPIMAPQLITVRIALPAGIELPADVAAEVINSQIETIFIQNDVEDLMEVRATEISLDDGSIATTGIYSGKMGTDATSINVTGIIALWSNSNSNTIVVGIVPDGQITLPGGNNEQTLLSIDGDQEMNEIIEMIKTIN